MNGKRTMDAEGHPDRLTLFLVQAARSANSMDIHVKGKKFTYLPVSQFVDFTHRMIDRTTRSLALASQSEENNNPLSVDDVGLIRAGDILPAFIKRSQKAAKSSVPFKTAAIWQAFSLNDEY